MGDCIQILKFFDPLLLLLLFSHSVLSDYLQPHGMQHARLPYSSLSPQVCTNSCPLRQWCQQIISSSVASSPWPQSFPALGSFPMSWLFASCGLELQHQFLSVNIQSWFPLGLTDLISLLSKGLSRVFSSTVVQKHQFFSTQPSLRSNSHIYTWLLEKP